MSFVPALAAAEYALDAWQRGILLLDILRQRGNQAAEHNARTAPHVLTFGAELLLDGRTLPRPVNYGLVRIVPPPGTAVDARKRPFIVFDPRAGHGPGIGGMKHDSEIGVALAAGHPCYFVGFTPNPLPGQTIGDVCTAEVRFIEEVVARHPQAEGKPCLIGNCQAGWQIMLANATRPGLSGPIILAGAPLSYWQGRRGGSGMRYLGGLLGGTWLTTMAGDLGAGIFDGANLVANFEAMHPDNTLWTKTYNVFSRADTEGPRFLEFEKWWGSPVLLNAGEMQQIADDLFVGNKLTAGRLVTQDGTRIDLREVTAPIVVFCSWGDDITPPAQALGWITDLYDKEEDIVAAGQTIVYCLHQSIGHLGIFVSGKVATREHAEFVQCLDMIDLMPPGLYEAVITLPDDAAEGTGLVQGNYLLSLQARRVADVRAIVQPNPADDRRFATVARVSEINRGLYDLTLRPAVRMLANETVAEASRAVHPNRLQFSAFSDRNPALAALAPVAEAVRGDRRPADPANPFLLAEHMTSNAIAFALAQWGHARDAMAEAIVLSVYGSPWLQALVGIATEQPERAARDQAQEMAAVRAERRLEREFDQGGPVAAVARGMMYVRLGAEQVDERTLTALERLRAAQPEARRLTLPALKAVIRDQAMLMRLDPERAVAAIPALVGSDPAARRTVLAAVRTLVQSAGTIDAAHEERLARVAALLGGAAAIRTAAE